ncbi:MAG: transglycosylase SLT domain-containing protein [Proteobacteria bacterium]|nr:transglycosylase SLT domain-containing protein [Pseudomonadota bacterium]
MPHRAVRSETARQRNRVAAPARAWRRAALGSGCSVVGVACLLLAACSAAPPKPSPAAPIQSTPASRLPPNSPARAPAPASTPAALGFWSRLRSRFALPDCDYNPDVSRLARWFSADPTGFAESLKQSLPFLAFVARQIEARDMPGEFALLPYIESNYVALASSGDRAAGIWQLLPDTAREAGLRIRPDYDGRLDVVASTAAALDLLERYYDRFGDWRVADMAFNAGPYRIGRLLGDSDVPNGAAELGRLRVAAHTHRHLAKLLAVACIVTDPSRYNVQLAEPAPADWLTTVSVTMPLDLQLAARLSGMDAARLRQLNPGYVRGRMPSTGPFRLLLPHAQGEMLTAALAELPPPLWREWHEVTLQQPEALAVLAQAHDIDARAFAMANAVPVDAILMAGTRVLVPGRGDRVTAPAAARTRGVDDAETHIVRSGDTLWRIARTAHVAVSDLLQWNNLTRESRLRPGQRLRLQAPDQDSHTARAIASPD